MEWEQKGVENANAANYEYSTIRVCFRLFACLVTSFIESVFPVHLPGGEREKRGNRWRQASCQNSLFLSHKNRDDLQPLTPKAERLRVFYIGATEHETATRWWPKRFGVMTQRSAWVIMNKLHVKGCVLTSDYTQNKPLF